jgi:outer membrane protein
VQLECRKRQTLWIVIVGLMGSAVPCFGETLQEALKATLETNSTLAAQQQQLAAVGQDTDIARSGFFPKLRLSASAGRGNPPGISLAVPAATGTLGLDQASMGYSVTLEQPLFDGFRSVNAFEEATENTQAAQEDTRAVKQQILLQAVNIFVAVLSDRATVAQRQMAAGMLARDLAMTSKLEKQGQATVTDIDQTNGQLALARSDVAAAEASLAASEAEFEQIVGHGAGKLSQPALPAAALPNTLAAAQALVWRGNPEIRTALSRERAASRAVDKMKADFLPQVSLEASYGRTYSNPPAVTDGGDAQLTVEVSLPISIGGETLARLRQAEFTWQQRRQEVAAKRREIAAQLASNWSALAALRRQAELSRMAAISSARALHGIHEQREAGEATALDVIKAEQTLLEAKLREIRSRNDLIVSAYTLLARIGTLPAGAN